jgi:hypothetical protein
MYLELLVVAGVASVFLLSPVAAAAQCCPGTGQHATHQTQGGCCDRPCCQPPKTQPGVEVSAMGVTLPVEEPVTFHPQLAPVPPVRQAAEVWFKRPVLVGPTILLGRYVIEHDNERMARGEPCTHIYAYSDRRTPVASFHCAHLERARAATNIVVLQGTADASFKRLSEFQFAGETASHGYPTRRSNR